MREIDYAQIEAEIACDSSPVGIDAKKTHVLILAKLDSIERRLDRIERGAGGGIALPDALPATASHGVAAFTDTVDDTVQRLAANGIDIDERGRHVLAVLEKLTDPTVLDALGRIVERIESLEPLTELVAQGQNAVAALTDTLDDEIGRAAARGLDVDTALRNGLAAVIYLGQRITTKELEALGSLLRSDVLHPNAVDVVGRLGCALVSASNAPAGSVGPLGAIGKLGDADAKRSTAFVLEFAKQFGAALNGDGRACAGPIDGGTRDV